MSDKTKNNASLNNKKKLLYSLAFAEAYKGDRKGFDPNIMDKDVAGITWTALNRAKRGGRFGVNLSKVVYNRSQFTGVGSVEWQKAFNEKFVNAAEKNRYKRIQEVVDGVLEGAVEDPTNGADHYYNPTLASPGWGKLRSPKSVGEWENYYEPTGFDSGRHEFFRETLSTPERRKDAR